MSGTHRKGEYELLQVLDKTDLRDPFKFTVEIAFIILASYLAGAVGVHMSYFVIFILVLYYVRRKRHMRLLKRVRHAESLHIRGVDIDEEKSILLKYVMKTLWSHYERMLSEWVGTKLQPLLDNTKPAFLDSVHISQISFGDQEPLIRSVKTHETKDDDHVVFDLDLSFVGQAHMIVDIQYRGGKMIGGLSKIPVLVGLEEFTTKLRLEFRLMDRSPWITTLDLGFVGVPKVDMRLKPLKSVDIMEFPGISKWLNDLVSNDACGYMVLPKTATINIGGDSVETTEENDEEKHSLCTGVFQVTVFEAKNLPRSDLTFGIPSAYCKVMFGNRTYRTKVVKKSRNPAWNETHEFFVKPANPPKLKVKVYDRSKLFMDTFIGGARLDMAPLLESRQTATWDTVVMVGSKVSLHLRCVYRPMVQTPSHEFDFSQVDFSGADEVQRGSARSSELGGIPIIQREESDGMASNAGSDFHDTYDFESSDDEMSQVPIFTPRKSVRNINLSNSPQTLKATNFHKAFVQARHRATISGKSAPRVSFSTTERDTRSVSILSQDQFHRVSIDELSDTDAEPSTSTKDAMDILGGTPDATPTSSAYHRQGLLTSLGTPLKNRREYMKNKTRRRSRSLDHAPSSLNSTPQVDFEEIDRARIAEAEAEMKGFNLPDTEERSMEDMNEDDADDGVEECEVSAGKAIAAKRSFRSPLIAASSASSILPSNPIDLIKNPLRTLTNRKISVASTAPQVAMKDAGEIEPGRASTGVLRVRVYEAQQLPRGGNGAYYVNLRMGQQRQSTSICKKGKPQWQDSIEFLIRDIQKEQVTLAVIEKNALKADETHGAMDMELWWAVDGLPHDMWIEAGPVRIHLEVRYRAYNANRVVPDMEAVAEG